MVGIVVLTLVPISVLAEGNRLTELLGDLQFTLNGQAFTIARSPDPEARLSDDFAKTSRICPPFCLQPMQALPGVTTLGEMEVIDFIRGPLSEGRGALIDARLPEWFEKGSIPSAVNVPFTTLAPENPFRNDILVALGARPLGGGAFDFSNALDLVIFCNGAWSDQSVRALRALQAAGYPLDRLHYYRGGMQDWLMLGLTSSRPASSRPAAATQGSDG
ncbi:rhodanese-like domain-containing protein [Gemmobacter serpentinus]|uniref:rhodanese-like domain-containing protein n=1 Tax=Gemmobacter serpentinus TaxID=2652247 RepID=UPI001865832A|nr:rhodanese-like domain-containing protein [Gemmobacter serpentinus]